MDGWVYEKSVNKIHLKLSSSLFRKQLIAGKETGITELIHVNGISPHSLNYAFVSC
jgi:hypothetical protein